MTLIRIRARESGERGLGRAEERAYSGGRFSWDLKKMCVTMIRIRGRESGERGLGRAEERAYSGGRFSWDKKKKKCDHNTY